MAHQELPFHQIAVLPSAPTDEQRTLYVSRRIWWLFPIVFGAFCAITYGFVRACLITGWFDPFLIFWVFAVIAFVISIPANYWARDFNLVKHNDRVLNGLSRYPSVDVWLPNCGEPIEVLRNTWDHVVRLTYPGDVNVYVLDDQGVDEVELLAREFGFVYLSRPNKGWMKKAGNLQFAYGLSDGEFVALFDADFCPRSDFLLELLPYFEDDERTAIVQSSQFFRHDRRQNWIERGASEVQEYFYRVSQVSRSSKQAAVCCGTNAIYRRAALDENGGMTMVPQGEDMQTGFDLTCKGWSVRYVPLNLAMGLNPSDLSAFFKQQYRWCTGTLLLATSRNFWEKSPTFVSSICYVAGFCYYIETALYNFVLPTFILAMLVFFPDHFRVEYYEVIVPAVLVMIVVYPLWHRCRYGLASWSIRVIQAWTYTFAITDFIRYTTIPWDATGSTLRSVTASRRFQQFRRALVIWNGVLTLAWFGGSVFRAVTGDWASFLFVAIMGLIWLTISWRVIFTAFSWREPQPHPGQVAASV